MRINQQWRLTVKWADSGPYEVKIERRGMTSDTALRVTRYFGGDETDAQGLVNLQAAYDFKTAARNVGKTIAREVRPCDQDQTAHA